MIEYSRYSNFISFFFNKIHWDLFFCSSDQEVTRIYFGITGVIDLSQFLQTVGYDQGESDIIKGKIFLREGRMFAKGNFIFEMPTSDAIRIFGPANDCRERIFPTFPSVFINNNGLVDRPNSQMGVGARDSNSSHEPKSSSDSKSHNTRYKGQSLLRKCLLKQALIINN